MPAVFWQAVPT